MPLPYSRLEALLISAETALAALRSAREFAHSHDLTLPENLAGLLYSLQPTDAEFGAIGVITRERALCDTLRSNRRRNARAQARRRARARGEAPAAEAPAGEAPAAVPPEVHLPGDLTLSPLDLPDFDPGAPSGAPQDPTI